MKELRKENYGGYNYALYENGERVKWLQLNKREVRNMAEDIERENAAVTAPAATKTARTGRYLELAARTGKKPHGRAWVCDLNTVERTSCPPEWEGELVNYVYEN